MTATLHTLLIAFIQKEDAPLLLRRFRDASLSVTSMESEGGFLRQRNATILAALPHDQVAQALDIIRDVCRTRRELVDTLFATDDIVGVGLPTSTDVPVGGATVLLLPITDVIKV